MKRTLLLLLLAVAAAVLLQRAAHRHTAFAQPPAENAAAADPAVALRLLAGSPAPTKLWGADFAAFVSEHPGQWIVAHAPQPCLSESEAAHDARAAAAVAIWPAVAARFPEVSRDGDWLRARFNADVIDGRLDADHLAERFQRPYGTVWTESILFDVSPQRVDSLVSSCAAEHDQWRHAQVALRKSIIATIVSVWLTCLFLNAITRGYFATRLRIAAALCTAAGVFFLL